MKIFIEYSIKNCKGESRLYKHFFKRVFDFVLALILLILAAIPMIIVAICIKVEDGGPVIYKSKRVGKKCKVFNTYKFRSMKVNREELKSNMTHEQMVTKVGKFIRKTSIDELPQLFNILRGQMSFIGPRPWIPEYYEWFTDEQKRRSDVLPGISGLAQVKGRNGINIFKKIEYDIYYVDHISLWLDIKLVFETIYQVFKETDAEISEQGIKEELKELKEQDKYTTKAV